MTQGELSQILADHALWLDNDPAGAQADLVDTNLTNVYLPHTNLTNANLTGANLFGINLSGANLSGANLSGANLIGANLTNVYLLYTNLTNANLFSANLTDAKFGLNIIDAALIKFATFSQDALMWLILRKDWAKVKDTVTIVNN
jgi:uncharacterized protein YjbI with pentapeptide repeats